MKRGISRVIFFALRGYTHTKRETKRRIKRVRHTRLFFRFGAEKKFEKQISPICARHEEAGAAAIVKVRVDLIKVQCLSNAPG